MAKKDNIIQFPVRKKTEPKSESTKSDEKKLKKVASKKAANKLEPKPAKSIAKQSKSIESESKSNSKTRSKASTKKGTSASTTKNKAQLGNTSKSTTNGKSAKTSKPASTPKPDKTKPKVPRGKGTKETEGTKPAKTRAKSKGKLIHVDFMNHNKSDRERTKTLDQIDQLDWREFIADIPGNEIISFLNSVGPCRFVIMDVNPLPDIVTLVWLHCPVCGTRQYSSLLSNGAGRRHNKCGTQIEETEVEISLKGESAVCVLNILRSIYIGKKINHIMGILADFMDGKEMPPEIVEEFRMLKWIGIDLEPSQDNYQELIGIFKDVFNFAEIVIDTSISFLKTLIELQGKKIHPYTIQDFAQLVKENSVGLDKFRLVSKFFSIGQ